MSIKGSAESNILRGRIADPDVIHGMSAYELDVMRGYNGTLDEWLKEVRGDFGDRVKEAKTELNTEIERATENAVAEIADTETKCLRTLGDYTNEAQGTIEQAAAVLDESDVLLWENDNRSEAFVSQTINISANLTDDMKSIKVVFLDQAGFLLPSVQVERGQSGRISYVDGFTGTDGELHSRARTRLFTFNAVGSVTFEGADPTNAYCTPYRIYGVKNKEVSLVNAYIRYSAHPDGTDFTETWSEGQIYIGTATALVPPTDKSEYTWALCKGEKGEQGDKGDKGDQGTQGKSAYAIAVERGFEGNEVDWLRSLKGKDGADGRSAYELDCELYGFEGSPYDWLDSLHGENGKDGQSAYELACELFGFEGSEVEWLRSLEGKDAYEVAVEFGLFTGTREEWLYSLRGEDGKDGKDGSNGEKGDRCVPISGTWVFNQVIEPTSHTEDAISFESGGFQYSVFSILNLPAPIGLKMFSYMTDTTPNGTTHNVAFTEDVENPSLWTITNEADRMITFVGTQAVSVAFYNWFTVNATPTISSWQEITEYIDKEIAEFDFVKIVEELPEEGLPNREYFVRKNSPDTNDLFDEYAWINIGTEDAPNWVWEFKGTKTLEIDLTDYVKKTDYASTISAGIVLVGEGLISGGNGKVNVRKAEKSEIDAKTHNYKPITPIMLDYAFKAAAIDNKEEWTDDDKAKARELFGAVGRKDYATNEIGGVIRGVAAMGFEVDAYGRGCIVAAKNSEIDAKSSTFKPIVPSTLDYAVKVGMTTNTIELTEEEKAAVRDWIGAAAVLGSFTFLDCEETPHEFTFELGMTWIDFINSDYHRGNVFDLDHEDVVDVNGHLIATDGYQYITETELLVNHANYYCEEIL